MTSTGERFKSLRLQAGLNQTELAEELRKAGLRTYSQVKVARTESGSRDMRLSEAITVSEFFGVQLTVLAGGSDIEAYAAGQADAFAAVRKKLEGLL